MLLAVACHCSLASQHSNCGKLCLFASVNLERLCCACFYLLQQQTFRLCNTHCVNTLPLLRVQMKSTAIVQCACMLLWVACSHHKQRACLHGMQGVQTLLAFQRPFKSVLKLTTAHGAVPKKGLTNQNRCHAHALKMPLRSVTDLGQPQQTAYNKPCATHTW